jgi:hypothetical protein
MVGLPTVRALQPCCRTSVLADGRDYQMGQSPYVLPPGSMGTSIAATRSLRTDARASLHSISGARRFDEDSFSLPKTDRSKGTKHD